MDAATLKTMGNEAFSAKRYTDAIKFFTEGINLEPNHVLYSNRSASYAALQQYEDARKDAEECIKLNPSWGKGYLRLGAALHGLKQYDAAIQTYTKGLEVEPTLQGLKDGIESVERDRDAAAPNPFAKIFGPDTFVRIQTNPQLAPFLAQPDYVQMINACMANPQMVNMYIKDQRFMQTFLALSGIQLPKGGAGAGDDDDEARPAPPKPAAQPAQPPAAKSASAASSSTNAAASGNSRAAAIKEEGNAHYKKREFDQAMAKYKEAFDLEPTNTVFLLNQTAVLFEQNEFESCIELCEKALEHGREHKCDYTTTAKLMTRQALCLQKLKRHDEAIPLFKKALVEHRNADTLAKLEACEKERKKLAEEAYFSPEISLQEKEKGNQFFKDQKYPEAVQSYTEAIKRNPGDHALYSNRAAAYLKLCAYEEAIKDCDKCLSIKPDFVKAFARKGAALFWTKQYHKALQVYEDGRKLDPTNAECAEGHQRTLMKIQEVASGQDNDEEVQKRALADPEIQAILGDSYMQMVLGEMQRDPARIHDYMRDANLASKINKLVSAGILRFGGPADAQQKGGKAGQRR